MRIENLTAADNISMNNMMSGNKQGMDAVERNLRKQLYDKQQELKELSGNENISPEEKMKKRQEICQEISDINLQLRNHQIERQREARQEKGTSMEEMLGGGQRASRQKNKNGKNIDTGLSDVTMAAMISADSSIKQANVQGNVSEQMNDRAGVLKAEIKQDGGRGNVEAKKEELADVEQKAANATAMQINTLGDANKTLKEAAENESDRANAGTDADNDKDRTEGAGGKQKDEEDNKIQGIEDVTAVQSADDKQDAEELRGVVLQQKTYNHVDVRL